MSKTTATSLRLDPDVQEKAYAIFKSLGLKPSQAFDIFLQQVILHRGLPFEVKIPNHVTLDAMKEFEEGDRETFETVEDMMKTFEQRR